jgi:hypothetical protein
MGNSDGKVRRARGGRGEGELAQLPSGSWRATVNRGRDANGKKIRAREAFPTKREAMNWFGEK